ncbi:MAG: hydantoinase/oxoprolinase family protein [Actinomycetia bacterium]|nr:hydantoinase/oxoprolinase family protein [Actinomycetes bacterium]
MTHARWRVAVDTGGTFTDVVAVEEATGKRVVRKLASTPDDPSAAFAAALDALPLHSGDVSMVVHGTTVATNAILEADYARLGLIVTEGYREMLEVGRQTVPGDFGDITWWIKPPRVVPLELVREVGGRLDHEGAELRALDEQAVRRAAREFRALGIGAVAVSMIHSYRNPSHEERARELVLAEHPDCFVSISADVIREYREYERTLTTCLNTGLMPGLSAYVGRLEARLADEGVQLLIMKSSGGVAAARELVERPVGAVLSGPAAGVVGACAAASSAGHDDVLTLDMGGTSTDIALVSGGMPQLLSEGRIDVYDLKVPMIDMTAVGAGGGSIAWLTGGNALRVGPRSAGSVPGPVAYGRGGEELTVTDANLVLGRIGSTLAGGVVELDRNLALGALRDRVAEPLGLSVEEAAAGVLELAVANITGGIRVVSVKRGRDPRDYALVASGGAGPLHACLIAGALGLETVVVPPSPGASSAAGLLHADVRVDDIVTDVQQEDTLDTERLSQALAKASARVSETLEQQGFGLGEARLEGFLDVRYVGQAYELRVPIDAALDAITEEVLSRALDRFHRTHEERYGYSYRGREPVEIVNAVVTGLELLAVPEPGPALGRASTWSMRETTQRDVYFAGSGWVETAVYERPPATAGHLSGPAIIEEYDATTVVDPGWTVHANDLGQLVLARGATTDGT